MSRPRVLLLRPGALGDVCMALPVAAGLTRHADVTWLLRPAYIPVLRLFPSVKVNAVPFLDQRGGAEEALVHDLTRRGFDAVLDLCHWPETSRLVGRLEQIPTRAIAFDPDQDRRLGVRLPCAELYRPFNVRVPVADAPHQADKWSRLVACALGLELEEWPLPPAPDASGDPLRVFLQPHASRPAKVWPGRCFADALAWLARRRPVEVLLNSGNRQEWPRAVALAARLLCRGVPVRVIVKDRSYRRLAGAIRRCHVAVGNDSGPMHLASLLGVPTVALFGPYSPEEFAPRWRSTAVRARGETTAEVALEDVLAAIAPRARCAGPRPAQVEVTPRRPRTCWKVESSGT